MKEEAIKNIKEEAIKNIKSNKFNGGNTVKRLSIINKSGLAKVQPYIIEEVEKRRYFLEATVGNTDYRVKITEENTPFVRYFRTLKDAERAVSSIIKGDL